MSGYLTHLKAMLVTGITRTFDADFPEPDFRNIHCSIEYPVEAAAYPGIWVDYEDQAPLTIAGIDHAEFTEAGNEGYRRKFTRWKFAGLAQFTVVALTSYERDRLYDELIRTMAFTRMTDQVTEFRQYVENNDLIAANMDFDTIESRGNAASPGTPWGTDEIIYERTISMQIIGEFISEGSTGSIIPLKRIIVQGSLAYTLPRDYEVEDLPVTDEVVVDAAGGARLYEGDGTGTMEDWH